MVPGSNPGGRTKKYKKLTDGKRSCLIRLKRAKEGLMRRFFEATGHLWIYSLPMAIIVGFAAGTWRIGLLSILVSLGGQSVHTLKWHAEEFPLWVLATIALLIVAVLTSFSQTVLAIADVVPTLQGAAISIGIALWDFGFHRRQHRHAWTHRATSFTRNLWFIFIVTGFLIAILSALSV